MSSREIQMTKKLGVYLNKLSKITKKSLTLHPLVDSYYISL